MSLPVVKLAPLIATVAGTAYFVSPYLQAPALPAAARVDLPKIESRWLSPVLEPASPRNPFVPWEASMAKAEEPKKSSPADSATVAAANTKKSEARKRAETQVALLDGWSLGATMIHGRRRGAVINNQVYLQGETIPPPKSEGKPLVLLQIARDHVVLTERDRAPQLLLGYAPPKEPTDAPKPGDKTDDQSLAGGMPNGASMESLMKLARGLLMGQDMSSLNMPLDLQSLGAP
jgi:hypothetical protein